MQIRLSRDTVGRLIGIVIVAFIALLISYLATAWIWWELNPGAWSEAARGTQLATAVALLFVRWLAGVVVIGDAPREE